MPTRSPPLGLWFAVVLVLLGGTAVVASRVVSPGVGEALVYDGAPFGTPCPTLAATGRPCAACGMTRSWVWAARGEPLRALRYNPAGVLLYAGALAGGVLGGARLATRNPAWGRLPWQVQVTGAALLLLLWEGVWLLRLRGYFPLP